MPSQASRESRRHRERRPLNPYLRDVLRGFRATLGSVFAFSFVINLLTLVVPLYLLQIYSKVLPSGNVDTLLFLTGMALVAVVSLGLLEAIRRALLAKAGARFERQVSEHLLDSAIRRAIAKSYPSVNALRDLATVRGFVSGSGMLPLLDLPWSPLFIAILFVLHPILGLIGTFGACVLFALAVLNGRVTREPLREANSESRAMLDDARAYVRNADVIQAMGLQGELLSRWNARGADATVASYRASRVNTRLASLSKLVRLFLLIGIICAAAWLITRGELTAGATIASLLLMRRAIAPIEQSIRSWKSVLSAREAFYTISEYLDHASTLSPASEMPVPDGPLVASRVGYRPSGAERSLFSRVELELAPGELAVLVGPTAAGKSTLLRVLAGILPPSSGRVALDGCDFAQWHPDQRGPHVGYLPQDVSLFPVSVRENVARLADAPIEAVVAAAERANAHELIQALPQGYDTLVDEDGANLSGGQQQRIGFARALFGDPKVVLLDEPDANLDAEGRSALRKSLRSLRRSGVALLAVTHHASLEKMADKVYRLEHGKVRLERNGRADVVAADADGGGTVVDGESTIADERIALIGPLPMAPVPAAIADALGGAVEETARPIALAADEFATAPGGIAGMSDGLARGARIMSLPRRGPGGARYVPGGTAAERAAEPALTVEPAEPAESVELAVPFESADSTAPAASAEPLECTEPADPDVPAESADPAEPTEPTLTVEPAEPAEPVGSVATDALRRRLDRKRRRHRRAASEG